MEVFAKEVNDQKSLTISAKKLHLSVRLVSKYVSASFFPGIFYILLGKKILRGKSLGEIRNKFLQIFGGN